MKHSKRIIVIFTFLFSLGIVIQPVYAVDCDPSAPCMPSQHASHMAGKGHMANADHNSCHCNPIASWSNSIACQQETAYTQLEMAVLRLDSDNLQADGNLSVANHRVMEDSFNPERMFGIPAYTPPSQKRPLYLQTLMLLI